MLRRVTLSWVLGLTAACGSTTYQEGDPYLNPIVITDAGLDAGAPADAGRRDSGVRIVDAGISDAGARDAGQSADAGQPDAGRACSATTCSGCCTPSGQCQTGQTNAVCGKNGVSCDVCSDFERCGSAQACELDPSVTWLVQPTAAAIKHLDWDSSPPDVRLDLWCPATRSMPNGACAKVQDSYDPTWSTGGCTGTTADLLGGGLGIKAIEVDAAFDDELCPFTTIAIDEAALRAGTVGLTSTCGFDSLTVTLTKQ